MCRFGKWKDRSYEFHEAFCWKMLTISYDNRTSIYNHFFPVLFAFIIKICSENGRIWGETLDTTTVPLNHRTTVNIFTMQYLYWISITALKVLGIFLFVIGCPVALLLFQSHTQLYQWRFMIWANVGREKDSRTTSKPWGIMNGAEVKAAS